MTLQHILARHHGRHNLPALLLAQGSASAQVPVSTLQYGMRRRAAPNPEPVPFIKAPALHFLQLRASIHVSGALHASTLLHLLLMFLDVAAHCPSSPPHTTELAREPRAT